MSQTAIANVPPGPRLPKPVAGYVVLMNHMPTLRRLHRRYGDAFSLDLPVMGQTVIVTGPELIKRIYTSPPGVLKSAEGDPVGEMLGPGSLFSLDGEAHLRERRLLLPPFHGDRMKSYEGVIEEEVVRELAGWPEGIEFATLPAFKRITLNVILRTVFGAEGPHQRRLADLLPSLVSLGLLLTLLRGLRRDFGPVTPGGRYRRLRGEYDGVIGEMVDEASADPDLEERVDVFALLLRARYDDGATMTRSVIADQLLTLLAAGHETIATSLAWTVERLRRHPALLARLTEEARGAGAELRQATIQEVLRTRPVITMTDRLVDVEQFELGEWRIPKGYRLAQMATLTHFDPRFFERPEAFLPERFLGRSPDSYAWIPFGGGSRRCIGAAFAQMEMNVALRTMLREIELTPTTEPDEPWKARGVAFAPARGGRASLRRRSEVRLRRDPETSPS